MGGGGGRLKTIQPALQSKNAHLSKLSSYGISSRVVLHDQPSNEFVESTEKALIRIFERKSYSSPLNKPFLLFTEDIINEN